jgi:4-oxalocrotonate tautomerase
MPIIQINLLEGRTTEQKRKLVVNVTEAVVKSLDVKPDSVRIILQEMTKQDYAIGGVLAVDNKG